MLSLLAVKSATRERQLLFAYFVATPLSKSRLRRVKKSISAKLPTLMWLHFVAGAKIWLGCSGPLSCPPGSWKKSSSGDISCIFQMDLFF